MSPWRNAFSLRYEKSGMSPAPKAATFGNTRRMIAMIKRRRVLLDMVVCGRYGVAKQF